MALPLADGLNTYLRIKHIFNVLDLNYYVQSFVSRLRLTPFCQLCSDDFIKVHGLLIRQGLPQRLPS